MDMLIIGIYLSIGISYGVNGQTRKVNDENAEHLTEVEHRELDEERKQQLTKRPITTWEFWFIQVPFSMTFGWFSFLTVLNVLLAWKNQFRSTSGVAVLYWSEQGWTIVLQALLLVFTTVLSLLRADFFFSAMITWGYIGVAVNTFFGRAGATAIEQRNSRISSIVMAVLSSIVTLGIAVYVLAVFIWRKKRKEVKHNVDYDAVLDL